MIEVPLAASRKNASHFSCGAKSVKLIQSPAGKARASRPRRNEVTRRCEPCHWMRVRQWNK